MDICEVCFDEFDGDFALDPDGLVCDNCWEVVNEDREQDFDEWLIDAEVDG